jgi:hypothetical protein
MTLVINSDQDRADIAKYIHGMIYGLYNMACRTNLYGSIHFLSLAVRQADLDMRVKRGHVRSKTKE